MSDSDYFQIDEVEQAIKDILYMYADLSYSYEGFGHNISTGQFDAFKFFEADPRTIESLTLPASYQFLKDGSIVKILCEIYDAWCEHETFEFQQFDRHKLWLKDGRFWEYLDVENVIRRLFKENPSISEGWVDEEFRVFYRVYVQKYFLEFAGITHQK